MAPFDDSPVWRFACESPVWTFRFEDENRDMTEAPAQPYPERAERFLLLPPVEATYGAAAVTIGDISSSGVRLRHGNEIASGAKSMLRFKLPGAVTPVALEGEVVWTQSSLSADLRERYVSGVRLHAGLDTVDRVIRRLHDLGRSHQVQDRRFSDRFVLHQTLTGEFDSLGAVRVLDLATKGARLETREKLDPGASATFSFPIPKSAFEVKAQAEVVWSRLCAIWGPDDYRFHAGVRIVERPELVRLAIGQLSELRLAVKDTQSLKLKLKIARALDAGPEVGHETVQDSLPGSEYFPLLQAVRGYLKANEDEGREWKATAEESARAADIRAVAGPIREHVEALAVWEYLERTIDPSLIALAFERHP